MKSLRAHWGWSRALGVLNTPFLGTPFLGRWIRKVSSVLLLRGGWAYLVPGIVVLAEQSAYAQKKPDAPPPISVPTDPVPLSTDPIDPWAGPAAKKAPAPPPAPSASAEKPKEPPPLIAKPAGPPKAFNDDGVFRVSGSGDRGTVVGGKVVKPTPTSPTPAPGADPKAPPVVAAKPAAPTRHWVPAAKKEPAVVAHWPGFHLVEGGASEVIVEFSDSMGMPSEHHAAGVITFVFSHAYVPKANNKNPLLTSHWNTPLLSARLVPQRGDLALVLETRGGVEVKTTSGVRSSPSGGKQFFVRFAPGSYLPKDEDGDTVGMAGMAGDRTLTGGKLPGTAAFGKRASAGKKGRFSRDVPPPPGGGAIGMGPEIASPATTRPKSIKAPAPGDEPDEPSSPWIAPPPAAKKPPAKPAAKPTGKPGAKPIPAESPPGDPDEPSPWGGKPAAPAEKPAKPASPAKPTKPTTPVKPAEPPAPTGPDEPTSPWH